VFICAYACVSAYWCVFVCVCLCVCVFVCLCVCVCVCVCVCLLYVSLSESVFVTQDARNRSPAIHKFVDSKLYCCQVVDRSLLRLPGTNILV